MRRFIKKKNTKNKKYIEYFKFRKSDEVIWNVVKNIDSYFNYFEEYLYRLVDFGLIDKNFVKDFIYDFWERLYNELIFYAYISYLDIDYGNEYLGDINCLINNFKKDLLVLKMELFLNVKYKKGRRKVLDL